MTPLKEKYSEYLERFSIQKLPLTKKWNEEQRSILTNHRSISGITPDHKSFCYTPVASSFNAAGFKDIDGNDYLDITMGFGVHLFGHNPPFVSDAIEKANHSSWALGPYYDEMLTLAQGIQRLTGVERLSFFNTGSEAVMVAVRLARAFTGKNKIVVFKGSYNGHNDSTLVFKTDPMSGIPLSLIPGIPQSSQADSILLDFNSSSSVDYIREHANEIAAVLTEPVQSRNPGCHPADFLRELRTVTREKNIVLIFDEVITGFRIAPGGAQSYFGVDADLVTYGKVIGGGMPIGIVGGKATFMDMIDGGQWSFEDDSLPKSKKTFVAGTFCNHPLTIAASNAVVQKLLTDGKGICDELNQITTDFANDLNGWMTSHHIGITCASFGSLFRIEAPSTAKLFFHQLLLEGIYIWEGRTSFFSTAHTKEDIDNIKVLIRKCALFMKASGFFPSPITLPQNNQHDYLQEHDARIAMNIGAAVMIQGVMDPYILEISFRYAVLCEEAFHETGTHLVITKEIDEVFEIDTALKDFIDEEKSSGFQLLLILHKGTLVCYSLVSDKRVLDGWSLNMLLTRTTNVYDAVRQGKKLPAFVSDAPSLGFSVTGQKEIKVSHGKKITKTSGIGYDVVRKEARDSGLSTLDYLIALFALSVKRIISPDASQVIIGSPVALQLKNGNKNRLGSFTIIESAKYSLENFSSLEELIRTRSSDAAGEASLIINIDRIVTQVHHQEYSLQPKPIDSSYIRYDIVVNILIGREDGLLVDVKWREKMFEETVMENFVQSFIGLMKREYASVQGRR